MISVMNILNENSAGIFSSDNDRLRKIKTKGKSYSKLFLNSLPVVLPATAFIGSTFFQPGIHGADKGAGYFGKYLSNNLSTALNTIGRASTIGSGAFFAVNKMKSYLPEFKERKTKIKEEELKNTDIDKYNKMKEEEYIEYLRQKRAQREKEMADELKYLGPSNFKY